MTAYFDTFRSIVLTPDNVTLLADGVSDTLTINANAARGLSLSSSASGSDTLDLNVDYNLFVPIGTSILRLQDVNSNTRDVTLSAGANITITDTRFVRSTRGDTYTFAASQLGEFVCVIWDVNDANGGRVVYQVASSQRCGKYR